MLRKMVSRKFVKELPNCEGLYLETFSDGSQFKSVLNWFFDGNPNVMEFNSQLLLCEENPRPIVKFIGIQETLNKPFLLYNVENIIGHANNTTVSDCKLREIRQHVRVNIEKRERM